MVACASHLGDCVLYGRRLERGYSVARCSLCAVAAIDMAMSQSQTESCVWQPDCDDIL